VDQDRLLTALIAAVFGAAGWLVVGLYIQRRQLERQARAAGRAVYFELISNRNNVDVALRHGSFQALVRSAYERLLPELAAWMTVDELETIARAYMAHAGYDQIQRETTLPAPVRAALLQRILDEHSRALVTVSKRSFSRAEASRLDPVATSPAALTGAASAPRAQGTGGPARG
jgi:hypothetical protein